MYSCKQCSTVFFFMILYQLLRLSDIVFSYAMLHQHFNFSNVIPFNATQAPVCSDFSKFLIYDITFLQMSAHFTFLCPQKHFLCSSSNWKTIEGKKSAAISSSVCLFIFFLLFCLLTYLFLYEVEQDNNSKLLTLELVWKIHNTNS